MSRNTATLTMSAEGLAELRRWQDEVAAAAPIPVSLVVAPDVLEKVRRAAVAGDPPPPYSGMPVNVSGYLPPGDAWAVYADGSMVNLRTGATIPAIYGGLAGQGLSWPKETP